MFPTIRGFSSLFFATLIMVMGLGLFNVYMGLKLTADGVSEVWVGALMSAYYFGLVLGARAGYLMIVRVGHVRAFAMASATAAVMVLAQTLIDDLSLWVVFRAIVGMSIVVQYIVIESWLNEKTQNQNRGRVFSIYLVVSGLGTALGQMAITLYPNLDWRPLTLVAIGHILCLIPIVWSTQAHPLVPSPAPLDIRYFVKRVPQALVTMFLTGSIASVFYSLGAVYGVMQSFDTLQVATFMSITVLAGLLAQWPVGWLSDRMRRDRLIGINGVILAVLGVFLWGWLPLSFEWLLVLGAATGTLQFTLYAQAGSFANDVIPPEKRVNLSATLLMVYGIGATIGPLLAGYLMRLAGAGMLYVFISACAVMLFLSMRYIKVKEDPLLTPLETPPISV
jgi:MFS family permease